MHIFFHLPFIYYYYIEALLIHRQYLDLASDLILGGYSFCEVQLQSL